MKYKLSIFCTVAAFLLAANAYSGEWHTITEYSLWSNTYEDDYIRVRFNTGYINPSNCTDPDSYMVKDSLTESAKQRIYSTLLAAKMSGKPIRLRIDGCQTTKPAIINVVLD